jgi:hypothetical protein
MIDNQITPDLTAQPKFSPVRIQRSRRKGFKTHENTIYVGRPTKFGNPFKLAEHGWIICKIDGRWLNWSLTGGFEIDDIVCLYEKWLKDELKDNPAGRKVPPIPCINELKGKNLSCFCSLSEPCHVDVLLKMANE